MYNTERRRRRKKVLEKKQKNTEIQKKYGQPTKKIRKSWKILKIFIPAVTALNEVTKGSGVSGCLSKPKITVLTHHRVNPPKTECGYLRGGVIENGRTRNPFTLRSVPVLVHIRVWVHIPGDPQIVQLRNATTTPTHHCESHI